ncbi:SPOR domain-containing protein [Lysobacter fragariae]
MAAKRGKSQARRNNGGGGNGSIPAWAWMVLGGLLVVVVILVAPKYLKAGGGDGFFRPQPNPDAQPVPVASDEDAVAPEGSVPTAKPDKSGKDKGDAKDEGPEYDFYTLLPGKEVPLSDAELAATEHAEAQRQAAQAKRDAAADKADTTAHPDAADAALPKPVDSGADTPHTAPTPTQVADATPSRASSATTTAAKPDSVDANVRYLLQAGAFQASSQAEELKAKIALLGLGARVESAQISGKTVYRVRMGPYGTASDLAEAKRKLSSGGLPAMAIKVK